MMYLASFNQYTFSFPVVSITHSNEINLNKLINKFINYGYSYYDNKGYDDDYEYFYNINHYYNEIRLFTDKINGYEIIII